MKTVPQCAVRSGELAVRGAGKNVAGYELDTLIYYVNRTRHCCLHSFQNQSQRTVSRCDPLLTTPQVSAFGHDRLMSPELKRKAVVSDLFSAFLTSLDFALKLKTGAKSRITMNTYINHD